MGVMGMQKEGAKPHPSSRQGEMAEDAAQIPPPPPSSPLQWHRAGRGCMEGGGKGTAGAAAPTLIPAQGLG